MFLKGGLEVIFLDCLCVDLACMNCCFADALGFWAWAWGRWGFVWVFCGSGDFVTRMAFVFVRLVLIVQTFILSVRAELTRSAAKLLAAGRHR